MDKLINIAVNNRFSCSECGVTITKGQPYFRRASVSRRLSHRVNLCKKCIIKMYIYSSVTKEELDLTTKEVVLEKLEEKI